MFDAQTIQLLNALPQIGDLNAETARSRLTKAYLEFIRLRVLAKQSDEELVTTIGQLREMGNGLELFCLIEFARQGALLDSGRAAAFIAAQSLELQSQLLASVPTEEMPRHILANSQIYPRVEAGLLYLIAGYYANARTMLDTRDGINTLQTATDYIQLRRLIADDLIHLLTGFIRLELDVRSSSAPRWNITDGSQADHTPVEISASIEARLLLRLSEALRFYLAYLSGENVTNARNANSLVVQVREQVSQTISLDSELRSPAEALLPHHLACLLEITFNELQNLAATHVIKPPVDSDKSFQSVFSSWIKAKASRRYALLWPSTREWLQARQSGGAIHTVVSMPTGSGKSFLGELAIVERLNMGWVLYLAPTNALVRQIQNDLQRELKELNIKVRPFLTDEYTTFVEETFSEAAERTVVVMTPEKASLAIRLKPEIFSHCSVCIFDECHLLAKDRRGATSDDFLARLLDRSPSVHILLMSAMLDRPDKLAAWLTQVTGQKSAPVMLSWKPTRSLRSLAVIPDELLGKVAWNKQSKGDCEIQLLGCSQIAWQNDAHSLYVDTLLPAKVRIKRERQNSYKWHGSVNDAARQVAVSLAQNGISTLLFLNTAASHVWSHASKCTELEWKLPSDANKNSQMAQAWLTLADAELGSQSLLHDYHPKGVTVHSGALLDEERRAAEIAYNKGLVGLMIATGTLSQGLNFPTQAVVMAGIEGNEYYRPHTEDVLNSLGRSGRAGFHNVGLSILVPKIILRSKSRSDIARQAPQYWSLLQKSDACLDPSSALKSQVDQLIAVSLNTGGISPEVLKTATLIYDKNEQDGHQSRFKKSFAAYLSSGNANYVSQAINAATKVVESYMVAANCPNWLSGLAQNAGLSIALFNEMYRIVERGIDFNSVIVPRKDFVYAVSLLHKVIASINPSSIAPEFGIAEKNGSQVLDKLPTHLDGQDLNWNLDAVANSKKWNAQWAKVFDLLVRWMQGQSYSRLAIDLFSANEQKLRERSSISPLHKTISSVSHISYPLRHISSGFVLLITKLLLDKNLIAQESDLPLAFGMLPQAIHWGVDRIDKAFWYYGLIPVRRVAHLLSDLFPLTYDNDRQIEEAVQSHVTVIKHDPSILSTLQTPDEVSSLLKATATILS